MSASETREIVARSTAADPVEALRDTLSEILAGLGIDYPFEQAWQQFQLAVVAQVALPLLAMTSWENLNPRGKELLQVLMERCFAIIADTDAVGAVRALPTTT